MIKQFWKLKGHAAKVDGKAVKKGNFYVKRRTAQTSLSKSDAIKAKSLSEKKFNRQSTAFHKSHEGSLSASDSLSVKLSDLSKESLSERQARLSKSSRPKRGQSVGRLRTIRARRSPSKGALEQPGRAHEDRQLQKQNTTGPAVEPAPLDSLPSEPSPDKSVQVTE